MPGAALLLFSGQPVHALEFLVIVLVVQQVDGNFIAPRILGSATGISGLWVLAAIVVGGGLFGIPGMVIGVPVLGVAANLAKAALPREPDGEKNKTGRGNIARNQCNIFHHTVCIMLRFCPLKSRR